MKLRIHENSIRLRLSQSDATLFAESGSIASSLELPGGSLVYKLTADLNVKRPQVDLQDNVIAIRIPRNAVEDWYASENAAIEGGEKVKILIEKDLACRHKNSDGDDASPNRGSRKVIKS